MMTTSARLLGLLSLLQARAEWSGAELADRLEVDVRTVRRDVDALRGLAYRVASSTGRGGGYRLVAGQQMPPLLLADDEAVAAGLALLTAASRGVAGLEEPALRAFSKLEQLVPRRLKTRIRALTGSTVVLGGPSSEGSDPAQLARLASACQQHQQVLFSYRAGDGREGLREVEPYRLFCTSHRWYLLAWDLGREDWRTFRVDRLSAVKEGARFVGRPLPADLSGFLSRALSTAPYPLRAKVRFLAPVSEVAQRVSPAAGTLTAEGPRSCVLETGSRSLFELAFYLASKGLDFEVLEPAALADELRAVGRRCLRASRRPVNGARAGAARGPPRL